VLEGMKMTSCACLLDPKQDTHVCGVGLVVRRWVSLQMDF